MACLFSVFFPLCLESGGDQDNDGCSGHIVNI
jgi:hypothetical protein